MIKIIQKFLISFIALSCSTAQAGWVDDWFDNATIDGTSSYNNQQRGFYSAGSFRGRVNMSDDYLMTASLPRLKSGCGGVDLFLGGMSFLDSDFLVEKFQSMIQAAPAVAFDIALKVYSKELSETMNKLEATTNWLNQLQLNDCAMTKTVVAEFRKDDPEVLGAVWNEMTSGQSLNQALNKNYQEAQQDIRANNNAPIVDLKNRIAGCPAEFKAIFSTGSLVYKTAENVGMGNYADVIRGYLGDVEIRANETDYIPLVAQIQPCPENDTINMDDMLYGNAQAKRDSSSGGACYTDNTTSVISHVRNSLNSISEKIADQTPLTSEEITFIDNSPVPVYSILQKAVASSNTEVTINTMTDIVASAYTAKIFDDLYRNIVYAFRSLETIVSMPGVSATNPDNICDVKLYAGAIEKFRQIHKDAQIFRIEANKTYSAKLQEHLSHIQYAKSHEDYDFSDRHNKSTEIKH